MNLKTRLRPSDQVRNLSTACTTKATIAAPADAAGHLAWRPALVAISLGFIIIVAIYFETAAKMVSTWYESETFNHGFLILPICLYLVWIRRERLMEAAPNPLFFGLPAVLAMAAVWLAGNFAGARVVEQFALVGVIQVFVVSVLGIRAGKILMFPLFYLVFAVPVGEFLIPPLQDLTAVFVVKALNLFGVPVFLEGIFLSIPSTKFEVAEACAGLRFLIATVALGFLFAEQTFTSWRRRIIFVLLSFIVPIVANCLRALGIVMIAHWTSGEYAVGVDHLIYGWIFFAFVTVIMIMVGMAFRDGPTHAHADGPGPLSALDPPANATRIASAGAIAVLIAAVGPAYSHLTDVSGAEPRKLTLGEPTVDAGWRLLRRDSQDWAPAFENVDAELRLTYVQNDKTVHFYVGYYVNQTDTHEVINQINSVADRKLWFRASTSAATVRVEGAPLDVTVQRLVSGERRRLALYWYSIGGTITDNPYVAKLLMARARLLNLNRDGAIIAIAADYIESPAEAEAAISDFLSGLAGVRELLAKAAAP